MAGNTEIDVSGYPRGLEMTRAWLRAYRDKEGKPEAEEKVLDWLVPLYELCALGQNVTSIICDIEAACLHANLNFDVIKSKAKAEVRAGTAARRQSANP